ncbi:MAG: hypothetical protein B7L53_01980 [Thermofilum sp. NZ13]|nr:MAG: hypothetical protein B7L53_01980 [Thermofilum sp. NZ13]
MRIFVVKPQEMLLSRIPGSPLLVSSAPGRVDFLNTHQDYKGLPVVPIAVNLRTYVAVLEESENFEVESLNLLEEGREHRDSFPPRAPPLLPGKWWGNYLRACVAALEQRLGVRLSRGFRAVIYSEVPVGSGLSSSAALEVAFLKAVDSFFNLGLPTEELAETAFYAENTVAGIPCGRLDQYASAYGGAILLYPRPPVRVERLSIGSLDFVVVDSGIRHSVADIHPRRQAELNQALSILLSQRDLPSSLRSKLRPDFSQTLWEEVSFSEVEPFLKRLPDHLARRVAFTLLMHESTMRVISSLKRGSASLDMLAREVNLQHELLRDYYDVSLPELEKMREAMLSSGALAVKLSGAGLGGSLFALTRGEEREKAKVIEGAVRAGARKGWSLKPDEGARVEKAN